MAGSKVTDPDLLAELNGGGAKPADPDASRDLKRGYSIDYSEPAHLPDLKTAGRFLYDRFVQPMVGAVTLPGDVAKGKVDPFSDEAIGRSFDLAGMITPVSPAARVGEQAIAGDAKNLRKRIPTTEDLYAAGREGFNAARNAGVEYNANSIRQMAEEARVALDRGGYIAETAPTAHKILDKLTNVPSADLKPRVPLDGLAAARKALTDLSVDGSASGADRAAARVLRGRLDEFIPSPPAEAVVDRTPAGQALAQQAGSAYGDAVKNWAAASRSDKLEGIGELADLQATAANSGLNQDNRVRSQIVSQLLDPRKRDTALAGYSPEEISAIEAAHAGGPIRNGLRYVGNLFGGGGGLGAMFTGLGTGAAAGMYAGGTSGGLAGAAIGAAAPVVGYGSKRVANALADRALDKAAETVRMRSPAYAAAPLSELTSNPQMNYLLLEALMGGTRERRPTRRDE